MFGNGEVVAEGRWQCKEKEALVNGVPIGPGAVKVLVDVVHKEDTFLWRPTKQIRYLGESVKSFVAWPARKCVFEETIDSIFQRSPVPPAEGIKYASPSSKSPTHAHKAPASSPKAPVKKNPTHTQSPLRRSMVIYYPYNLNCLSFCSYNNYKLVFVAYIVASQSNKNSQRKSEV